MTVPLVSVIIPTYNRAQSLQRAIHSVQAQTCADWELIVVDDGSIGYCRQVVNGMCDSRITYLCHEQNMGVSAARNTGIRSARGTYVAFLDDDDEWQPGKLQAQVNALGHCPPNVGAVYTGALFVDEVTGRSRVKLATERGGLERRILECNPPGSASRMMVRRECFARAGFFDSALTPCEDWDMWLRLSREYEFECIPEPLTIYHEHPGATSANTPGLIAGYRALWAKHGILQGDRELRAIHFFLLGNRLAYVGHPKVGRGYLRRAWMLRPLCLQYFVAYAATLLGPRAYRAIAYLGHVREPAAFGATSLERRRRRCTPPRLEDL